MSLPETPHDVQHLSHNRHGDYHHMDSYQKCYRLDYWDSDFCMMCFLGTKYQLSLVIPKYPFIVSLWQMWNKRIGLIWQDWPPDTQQASGRVPSVSSRVASRSLWVPFWPRKIGTGTCGRIWGTSTTRYPMDTSRLRIWGDPVQDPVGLGYTQTTRSIFKNLIFPSLSRTPRLPGAFLKI